MSGVCEKNVFAHRSVRPSLRQLPDLRFEFTILPACHLTNATGTTIEIGRRRRHFFNFHHDIPYGSRRLRKSSSIQYERLPGIDRLDDLPVERNQVVDVTIQIRLDLREPGVAATSGETVQQHSLFLLSKFHIVEQFKESTNTLHRGHHVLQHDVGQVLRSRMAITTRSNSGKVSMIT
ncbi:MAG: hypothetical protein Ct9H300mP1_30030 [Planctomycetaceae bacterium]|nr:MAG: hypothetical protein Ct9H300mP1_30030 [Planctomycetaceae bacterium]